MGVVEGGCCGVSVMDGLLWGECYGLGCCRRREGVVKEGGECCEGRRTDVVGEGWRKTKKAHELCRRNCRV